MRVVTSNLHAGVDGWGRPTSALQCALNLAPDVLVCPEMWRGEEDFVATLAAHGYVGHFAPLTAAERVRTTSARTSRRWQPRTSHLTGERGLYYGTHRRLTWFQQRTRRQQTFEAGTWGLGLFSTTPLTDLRVVSLGRLPRERVERVAIVAQTVVANQIVTVVAVHGAHLTHGSPLWFRRLRHLTDAITTPVIVAGDFNAWTPIVRRLLPGFTPRARGRTWPNPRPHSQIDHVLTRGTWRVSQTGTADGGSDHRALYVDLDLEASSS